MEKAQAQSGGLAQLARAPALQAGGHRFDSDILHKERSSLQNNVIESNKMAVARFETGTLTSLTQVGESGNRQSSLTYWEKSCKRE